MKKGLFLMTLLFGMATCLFAQNGRTLDLDGADDYLLIPTHDDFNVATGESFTITFYAKVNTLTGTPRIVSKRDMQVWNGPAYEFYINGSTGYAENLRSQNTNFITSVVSDGLTAGRWYHFAIVINRTDGTFKIYRSGLLKQTITNAGLRTDAISNTNNILVGAAIDSRETNPIYGYLNGSIDNLRFWKKALSVKEIHDDFTFPITAGQPDLVAAYDFQNIENNIVQDISGRGHHATLFGKNENSGSGTPSAAEYCIPLYSTTEENSNSIANRYVARATTSGATGNISYTATSYSDSRYVNYTDNAIRTTRGESFTLNLVGPSNGATNLSDGIQYTQTDVYADWNCDGVFSETEKIAHSGNIAAASTGQSNLTFTITVPQNASGGDTRIRVRYYDAWTNNHPAPDACSAGRKCFSIDFAMNIDAPAENISINSTELYQETIWAGQGNKDEAIVRATVSVAGAGNPLILSSIDINMNGTTNIDDVNNVKIYIADDDSKYFDPSRATLFGEATPSSGTITVSGIAELTHGNSYIWVAYDLSGAAIEGNKLDAQILKFGLGEDSSSNYVLSTTSIEGDRTILLGHFHLFKQNTAGSLHYRIPALITAADGSLIAAADKRWDRLNDLDAHLDVVVTRSTDNGKSWSAPITIAGANTTVGYGDPALVLDNVYHKGRLLCIFASGAAFWGSTQTNPIAINVSYSDDNGLTWTAPQDITSQIYGRSPAPLTNIHGAFAASGRALQLKDGRIMFVIAARNTTTWGGSVMSYVVYSDNGGDTWTASTNSPTPNSTNISVANCDEAKVVELSNGNILMSIRNRENNSYRLYATSSDKGMTWNTRANWSFQATNCNGDVIYYTYKNEGFAQNRMLHSIPNHPSIRQNVSVKLSYDDGNTWSYEKSICPGYSAYSSLTILPDNTVGIFYEKGKWDSGLPGDDYFELYFARFSLNWLTDGNDTELDSYHTITLVQDGGDGTAKLFTAIDNVQIKSGSTVRNGTRIILTLNPADYSGIESVMINGVPITIQDNQYEFVVDSDKEVRVIYSTTAIEKTIEPLFTIYPNPTSGFIKIISTTTCKADLYDLSGRMILTKQLHGNGILNLKSIVKGSYLLKVTNNKGESKNFRIIRN